MPEKAEVKSFPCFPNFNNYLRRIEKLHGETVFTLITKVLGCSVKLLEVSIKVPLTPHEPVVWQFYALVFKTCLYQKYY